MAAASPGEADSTAGSRAGPRRWARPGPATGWKCKGSSAGRCSQPRNPKREFCLNQREVYAGFFFPFFIQLHMVSQIFGSCDVCSSFHLFPFYFHSQEETVPCANCWRLGVVPSSREALLVVPTQQREMLSQGFLNNRGANCLPRQSDRVGVRSCASYPGLKQATSLCTPFRSAGWALCTGTAHLASAENTMLQCAFSTVNYALGFCAHLSQPETCSAQQCCLLPRVPPPVQLPAQTGPPSLSGSTNAALLVWCSL